MTLRATARHDILVRKCEGDSGLSGAGVVSGKVDDSTKREARARFALDSRYQVVLGNALACVLERNRHIRSYFR